MRVRKHDSHILTMAPIIHNPRDSWAIREGNRTLLISFGRMPVCPKEVRQGPAAERSCRLKFRMAFVHAIVLGDSPAKSIGTSRSSQLNYREGQAVQPRIWSPLHTADSVSSAGYVEHPR